MRRYSERISCFPLSCVWTRSSTRAFPRREEARDGRGWRRRKTADLRALARRPDGAADSGDGKSNISVLVTGGRLHRIFHSRKIKEGSSFERRCPDDL